MTEERIPYPHPGDLLRHEWMVPWGHSAAVVAHRSGVPVRQIRLFIDGQIPVTDDLAARLSAYSGADPCMWLGLQADYDHANVNGRGHRQS